MHKISASKFFGILIVSGALIVLGACNTTAGAGKDVSAVGHAVTDTADGAK